MTYLFFSWNVRNGTYNSKSLFGTYTFSRSYGYARSTTRLECDVKEIHFQIFCKLNLSATFYLYVFQIYNQFFRTNVIWTILPLPYFFFVRKNNNKKFSFLKIFYSQMQCVGGQYFGDCLQLVWHHSSKPIWVWKFSFPWQFFSLLAFSER